MANLDAHRLELRGARRSHNLQATDAPRRAAADRRGCFGAGDCRGEEVSGKREAGSGRREAGSGKRAEGSSVVLSPHRASPFPLPASPFPSLGTEPQTTHGDDHMPDLERRRFFGAAAATVAASQLGLLAFSRRLEAMTQPITEVPQETSNVRSDIRPFHVSFPDEQLADLRRRVKATKWPERETVADDTQGLQLATMQALASYWADNYDWRKAEAKLNSFPNFITNIDGLDIHFIHVKSKEKNALPMIVTHGWPGSV